VKTEAAHIFLISSEAPELVVAQLRDGHLFDLFIERGGRLLGDIFRGRVANVLAGMDAAFVDIGLARNALIYAGDCLDPSQMERDFRAHKPIGELLKIGDEVLLQVAKPPVGGKGARVTMRLALAGRFVVLTQHTEGIGVSRRIESEDERGRLRRIAEKLCPLGHNLIIRTEGEGVSESEIARDIQQLAAQLKVIQERGAVAQAPALIHRETGLLGRLVRDRIGPQTAQIVVDNKDVFETVVRLTRLIAPEYENRITLYDEPTSIFKRYGIDKELARARERIVELPSGGAVVFDEAEALCAVDVNTAKFTGKKRLADTVLQTNLEAVEETARQLRLRDIGGVIVIDLIDMERRRDSVRVLEALEAALKQDRARVRIVQYSPSGLVEIIRRREGQSLRQLLHRPCPYCAGSGVVKSPQTTAIETRRRIREMTAASDEEAMELLVALHPEVALWFLGSDDEYIRNLEASTGARIFLQVEPSAHLETSTIEVMDAVTMARWPQWKSGEVVALPADAMTYPAKEPRFIVHHNVFLETRSEGSERAAHNAIARNAPPAALRIEHDAKAGDGRWYFSGRILARHDSALARD
jgi:ribonuclease G